MESAAITLGFTIGVAIALVAYAYIAYPIIICVCAKLFGRRPQRPIVSDEELPKATLLIAAYNEEHEIRKRIQNALAIDYPAGKLEIVIASDGSSDETPKIVREFARYGVKLLDFPNRRGKSTVLNEAIPACRSEIILLSDANTETSPDAARKLAAWFTDPDVGVVCGKLILTDPENGRNVDGIYWKYENFLKKWESHLGGLLGSNGGIYAIRKSVFQPIPNDTIVDDFVLPLLAKQRTGCAIVYDKGAKASEETPSSIMSEFQRRARIGAGGFQALCILYPLLHPRHGWLSFTFFNHKFLRWVSPLLMVFALFGNLIWIFMCMPHVGNVFHLPWAAMTLSLQVGFYASSLLAGVIPPRPRALKVLRLPAMFTSMNAALAVGFWRWSLGRQKSAWKRTAREGEKVNLGKAPSLDDTGEHLALQQTETNQAEHTDRTPLPDQATVKL